MPGVYRLALAFFLTGSTLAHALPAKTSNADAIAVLRVAAARTEAPNTPRPTRPEVETTREIEQRLQHLRVHRLADSAVPTTTAWLRRLAAQQVAGKQMTVLDHVTVGYVLRSGLGGSLDEQTREQAEDLLVGSWRALTGKVKARADILDRLPKQVLRNASPEARVFHMASFQESGRFAPVVEPTELGRDYVPTKRDVAAAAAAAAIATTTTGGAVLGTIAAGYVTDAAADYFNHRFVAHEGLRKVQPVLDRLGPIGRKAQNVIFNVKTSHLGVHHLRTTNQYYTGKLPADVRKEVDQYIDSLPPKLAADIRETEDGIKQTVRGALSSLSTSLAFNTPLALASGKPLLTMPLLMVPATASVLALTFLHPRLHDPVEVIESEAKPLMRGVVKLRYIEAISRLHYIHHKGGGGNYNLGLQGIDYLFGTLRKPNMNVVLAMHDQHLVGAYWGDPDRAQ